MTSEAEALSNLESAFIEYKEASELYGADIEEQIDDINNAIFGSGYYDTLLLIEDDWFD